MFSNMNLRDFESILIYFSEEDIQELEAAIAKRKNLASDEEGLPKLAEQSDYSANGVEGDFSEIYMQHPA
jgi:hypothetical protein